MYALILPASTPFVLLATVMALSWWEDRILPTPPAEPPEAPAQAPVTPAPHASSLAAPTVRTAIIRAGAHPADFQRTGP